MPELVEANTCLALERDTACVFHLMRGVEYGLRALAGAVGVSQQPTIPMEYKEWQPLIEEINSKQYEALRSWRGAAKADASAFFNRIVADLFTFKDEVRNPLCTRDEPIKVRTRLACVAGSGMVHGAGVESQGRCRRGVTLDPARFAQRPR